MKETTLQLLNYIQAELAELMRLSQYLPTARRAARPAVNDPIETRAVRSIRPRGPQLKLGMSCMPKYFFNVRDVEPSTDYQGELLADDEAAWEQATRFAGDVMKDIDGRFRPGQEWSVEVTDKQKRMLYRIQISSWKTN